MSITPLEALERRRTIRQYDPDWQIPKDQMDKIMHAAQLSQCLKLSRARLHSSNK